ncbi:GSCFA domain-containing protein [Flavihumibacter sp. CACIAM 22H1]|uniref:GSCFA domain-containing protein n=1 Tax=Flavihumibacter sp. CACIAM 22H1 TaxID=1812911 RepID=UPI0007A88071|nr:GSCFA domain-containing protein [Flavihumibacter sp. CACIAM 22H1]KYP14970.1 MAG: GSCFA domain-containing protein [Flavihumibacter sp. CACIAM 22H1]
MKWMTDIQWKGPEPGICYKDPVFLIGSCFTEHIGNKLQELKYSVLQNPHGILFDPISVCNSLVSYLENKRYQEEDLFYYNELWHSWSHHSRFSGIHKQAVLEGMNAAREAATEFLKKSRWLIITLGSSYSYRLTEKGEYPVANCHRYPAQHFRKHLCSIDETVAALDNVLHRLFRFNPSLEVIFTVSPVRHLRDGVVENNRSKARLLEAVHHLVDKFNRLHYFPAYELVIDVLRDYRFYDIDLAHPNYQATSYVLEQFKQTYIQPDAQLLMDKIQQVVIAGKHTAFQPETTAHKNFLQNFAQKTRELQDAYPYLDFSRELAYFQSGEKG